jgi:hypothetical protein
LDSQDPTSNLGIKIEMSRLWNIFLITSKVLDARRRGATNEAYGAIRRKPVESLKVEREERSKATPPFGFTQGHEPVEWQMMI